MAKEGEQEDQKEQEQQQQEAEKMKNTNDYNSIQPGEYSIHLYLEETRNLISNDIEKALDPMIKVEAFGQTKLTPVKKSVGVGMTYWGEHMFFEKTIDNSSELEVDMLRISVLDHNLIGYDSLVGLTEMDVLSVYFSDEHAIKNRWVILANISKDCERIMGFLKFSVQVYAKGDQQVVLKDEESKPTKNLKDMGMKDEGDDEQFSFGTAELLLPPSIKTISYYLKVTLIKGENLIKMDLLGTIDPFLVFEFGSSRFKTKKINNNANPVWNQVIYIPFSEPMISQLLNIKAFDYDLGTKDEIVGSMSYRKADIMANKYKEPFWINIYGSQKGSSQAKKRKLMNSVPAMGSFWKGRILMKIEAEQAEKPQQKVESIPDQEMAGYLSQMLVDYTIQVDLYYGVEFAEPKDKYTIMIRWADQEISFQKLRADRGVWKFYNYVSKTFSVPYKDEKDLPDIFIYLVHDGDKVCYIRKSYKYFHDMLHKEPQLFSFLPDMAESPNLRDDEAGMIKMKIVIGPPHELAQVSYKHANETEMPSMGNIICNIYNCQDLIPGDDCGNSDPFITMNYYGTQVKTTVIEDSVNPIFNCRLVMEDVPIFRLDGNPPPITLKIFDKDFMSNDFLGSAMIDLKEMHQKGHLRKNKFDDPTPIWINLRYGKQKNCGRVLVSFLLFDYNNEIFQSNLRQLPRQIQLKSQKYHVKIRILGLRDLKSLGLLPVKNAFLKFDINSLLPINQKRALAEEKFVTTQPAEKGENPNICTIISFDVDLPVDTTYCPHMSVLCQDKIMKGLFQPMLGTFSIDLPKYIHKTKLAYTHKIRKATDFLLTTNNEQKKQLTDSLGFDIDKMIQQRTDTLRNDTQQFDGDFDRTKSIALSLAGSKPMDMELGSQPNELNLNLPSENIKQNLLSEPNSIADKPDPFASLDKDAPRPSKLLLFQEEKQEQPIIQDALQVLANQGEIHDPSCILQFAKYSYNKQQKAIIEEVLPDPDKFLPLSWDPKATRLGNKVNKHYRYYVTTELEKTLFVDSNTFDEFQIHRGSRLETRNFFGKLQKPETVKKAGMFKGWVEIISDKQKQIFKKNLISKLLPGMMSDNSSSQASVASSVRSNKSRIIKSTNGHDDVKQNLVKRGQLDSEFLAKQPVVVRVYLLQATGLMQMDNDSYSDPYVVIRCGDQVINDVKNYQTDMVDCDFYRLFEIKTVLPGASQLHVQFWDKDSFVRDDMIGETIIDLENRFFSKKWRNLPYMPIETRELFSPFSSLSRGQVKMFLEIIPSRETAMIKEIWNIAPKPAVPYELRVVVWKCEDCPTMDIEDCSDLFVTAKVGDDRQQTDVHYRSQNGDGSFNYRLVFPVTLPMKDPSITFAIWDKDILSPSDFISEGTLSFQDMADKAFQNDCAIKLMGNQKKKLVDTAALSKKVTDQFQDKPDKADLNIKGEEVQKFSIALRNVEKPEYFVTKEVGKITITMELVPSETAKNAPVGKGRNEPNHSPFCPPPEGRLQWSLNPCVMFNRLVGPKARRKVIMCLCCVLMTVILVFCFPVIFGNVFSKIIGL